MTRKTPKNAIQKPAASCLLNGSPVVRKRATMAVSMGRRREEQPNVGSHAVFEGIVFRQEIKGTAKDPRSREQQFLTKSSGRMTVRIRGEEDK